MSAEIQHPSKINIISTSTIKADSTARFSLTPWDLQLLFIEYSQKGLLFLKPTPLQETAIIAKFNSTSLIDHLKRSLEHTLHFFLPLTGRLTTAVSNDGAATCFSIECKEGGGGALFVHATANHLTVADILNSNYVPEIVRSFFPLNGVHNYDGVSQPLMAVQVTELADGLFIGLSINHMVADGTSFWHFFNSWAQISRGNDTITKLPFLNRDQINLDLIGSNNIYISNQDIDTNKNLSISESPPLLLCDQIFHLSKESVAKLKERANQEAASGNITISSLQAVIAHFWVSLIRCCFATDLSSQETTFEIPMGARQRLNPPLPEEYFGNAVFPGELTFESGNLLQDGPGRVARKINEMVASNNGREFSVGWIKRPVFLQFGDHHSNHFTVINSPRFNVYGNDFGWGKPVGPRSGRANCFEGRITVNPGLEEGIIDIEACLTPETLSKLTEDAEFMDYVVTSKH